MERFSETTTITKTTKTMTTTTLKARSAMLALEKRLSSKKDKIDTDRKALKSKRKIANFQCYRSCWAYYTG